MAGYTVEMNDFLDANPGLASRFSKIIEFENYSAEELLLITSRMVAGGDYLLDPAAGPPLTAYFDRIAHGTNFGNAREARRLIRQLLAERPAERGATADVLVALAEAAGELLRPWPAWLDRYAAVSHPVSQPVP